MWIIEARVFNQTDNTVRAVFSNLTNGGCAIHKLKFRNNRIGGCEQLMLTADRLRTAGHTVSTGNIIEVWIYNTDNSDDTFSRRYKGVIRSIKQKYSSETITIMAWGLWEQFKWQTIVKYMETTDVADVVGDIFNDIKANTYCDTTGNISLASSAAIGDIELYFQQASDVIKKLAEIQGSVDYGVDEDGIFYFIDSITTNRGIFQVGVNITDLEIVERADELCNDYFLRTRNLVSSGNLTLHEDDDTSIAAYKKRTKVIDAPEFSDSDDAITWGQALIAANKDPVTIYSFKPILSTEALFDYTGKVNVLDENCNTLATLTIEGIEYSFGNDGFSQRLYAGDREAAFDPGSLFANIENKVAMIEAANIASKKIEHSAYDEFKQYIYENAFAAGKYNVWDTNFSEDYETDYIDKEESTNISFGDRIKSMVRKLLAKHSNPFSGTAAILQTYEIPAGRSVDSVRLYWYADHYGRYDFNDDSVLQDWYNAGVGSGYKDDGGYIIDETNGYLVGNPDVPYADRGVLWFTPQNWAQQLTTDGLGSSTARHYFHQNASVPQVVGLRINDVAITNAGDECFRLVFNYFDSGNYVRLSLSRKDADEWTFTLDPYINTVKGTSATLDVSDSYTDFVLTFSILPSTDKSRVTITGMTDDTPTTLGTLDVDRSEQAKQYIKIERMWNSEVDDGHVGLKWFEIYTYSGEPDRVVFKISRDGGTTWTNHTPSYNTAHSNTDVDISSQPAGNKTLILRAELRWPAVLYGMGLAWSGN